MSKMSKVVRNEMAESLRAASVFLALASQNATEEERAEIGNEFGLFKMKLLIIYRKFLQI